MWKVSISDVPSRQKFMTELAEHLNPQAQVESLQIQNGGSAYICP